MKRAYLTKITTSLNMKGKSQVFAIKSCSCFYDMNNLDSVTAFDIRHLELILTENLTLLEKSEVPAKSRPVGCGEQVGLKLPPPKC